ncbi:MAG: hypothetical protein B7X93_10575 [Hydrogenophilales bacterium 17-61-9]|nr:MAG: hypothetical protein B7X93_10575 [Hydrogenophilales bacterium 17-61-9]
MLQIIFMIAPFAIALLLALALAVGPFALQGALRKWSDSWRAVAILWLIAISAVLNVVLVPRKLIVDPDTVSIDMAAYAQGAMTAGWLSRIFTLALIGFSLAMLLSAWLAKKKDSYKDPVWSLGVVLGLYYLLSIVIGATVSAVPGFNHKSLYIPIVLGALIAMPRIDFTKVIVHLKWILAVVMLMNLIAAVGFSDFSLLRPYAGLLPGIDFRLFGVFAHPNTLGPTALLLLLLELYYPSRSYVRWLFLLLALSNFLMAQSKTAWLAAAAILILVYVPYRFMVLRERPNGFAPAVLIVLVLISGLIAGMLGVFAIGFDRIFSDEVLSFTGRTSIWAVTLDEFVKHPLFGYGPELWSREYRFQKGILGAGQAHNQFVQTLGESGLVGFVLLMTYLGILLKLSLASFRGTRGLSLALFLLIFMRCMTEAPLRGVVNDWPFFIHATLLLVLVSYARKSLLERKIPGLKPAATQRFGLA